MIDSNRLPNNGESLWTNVTPSSPCSICGRGDWCFLSKDGRYAGCRREGRFDGEHRIDASGCDYWLYDLSGESGHIVTPPPPSLPKNVETLLRADVDSLDKVYRELLSKLTLSDDHRANLQKRGLPDEEIDRRGYRTWPKSGRASIAKALAVQFGDSVLKGVPGFYQKQDDKNPSSHYWSLTGGAGLAIPVRDEQRRIIALRIRLDDPAPGAGKYIWLSSAKHNGPSPGAPLHFPGFDEELTSLETIRITEGELKADIATVLSNVFTLSLPGVLNWRAALPLLEKFPSIKTIRIAFDADAPKNVYVATALKELSLSLCAKEYAVEIETWDASAGKGIDDVLAAGSDVIFITGEDVGPRLEDILEAAKQANPPRYVKQLDEAKRRIDIDNLAEKLDSPDFLNDRENIEALAMIKRLEPGEWLSRVKPILKKKGMLRDIEKLIKKCKPSSQKPGIPQTPDTRPVIKSNGRDLHELTQQTLDLLRERNKPPVLFLRSGEIVRIRLDEKNQPVMSAVDSKALRQWLAEIGRFVQTFDGGTSNVNPPLALCENLLELPRYPFPGLEGVVEIPVVRPDGTIHLTPGYDPATNLFYARDIELLGITVKDSPDQDDVANAKEIIIDILFDFPFVNQSSFANTVALLFSPFIRHTYDGCSPLAIIDAPKGGSGKSLLARIVSIIATGQKAAVLCAPDTDAEWRKRITSTLSTGKTIIILDNVENSLWAPALEAVLTTTIWEDRELGKTRNLRLPQRATWIATGNNVQLRRALPRRCYQIRLDPMTDKPEEVEGFRHSELESYVKKNRSRIIEAVLTLIRAWYAAGCPKVKAKPLGGFEDWARNLHGILAYAGIEGFLGNRAELYQQADEDGPAWEGFLAEWFISYGDRTMSISEIVQEIEFNESFRNALPATLLDSFLSPKGSFRKKFGLALSKKKDTQFGEHRLEMRGMDSHSKQKSWGIRKNEESFAGSAESAERFFHRLERENNKNDKDIEYLRKDAFHLSANLNDKESDNYSYHAESAESCFNPEEHKDIKYTYTHDNNMCVYIKGLETLSANSALSANPKPPNGIPDHWLESSKSWPESTQTAFKGFLKAYHDGRVSFDEVERAYLQFQKSSTNELVKDNRIEGESND